MRKLLHAICDAEAIPPERWDLLPQYGFTAARIDVMPAESDHQVYDCVQPALDRGLWPLVIVQHPAQVEWLPPGVSDIEVSNEPDIGKNPAGVFSPAQYISLVQHINNAATVRGETQVWAGAISNLDQDSLAWLALVAPNLPPEVGISFHRYCHGNSPQNPHPGFRSRDDEMASLRAIAGPRKIAHSEGGFHTAPRDPVGIRETLTAFLTRHKPHFTDNQVAAFWREEWAYLDRQDLAFATCYQIMDGPTDTAEGRYGILTETLEPKPVASILL